MNTILAIETSCDETAVAVLRGSELLFSEVASQAAEHEKYGGVVPEVASRNHLVFLPRLLERASRQIALSKIDAFAATSGPGLASSLLVGNSAAKALAIGARKPFLAINHLEGHLLSPFFGTEKIEPHIALVVSGGHTLLVNVRAMGDYEILGRTVDDATGEAFDKVAKLIGLGYPGGPLIEKEARSGDPARFDLPRGMLDSGDLNFSFSGLKTAVRYLLPKFRTDSSPPRSVILSRTDGEGSHENREDARAVFRFAPDDINDLCASFQQAVIDVLREKSLKAMKQSRSQRLTLSGGVSCNEALRKNLRVACESNGIEFLVAEPWLCTDNAAMIAFAAMLRVEAGLLSRVTDEIDPNLALAWQAKFAPCGQGESTAKRQEITTERGSPSKPREST
ncbi:MAG: tRNA (adenosine(37)-N6)-threonylcarbamoyltransferase complex transferase subunit TsaD [Verrucomicrobiota bacterium]|nr:tRNA (adenosine(37)-N6)-threonylcarbamoyltransferase complex transferase subunit TsaD [Verrucomicrobiota bacterium]